MAPRTNLRDLVGVRVRAHLLPAAQRSVVIQSLVPTVLLVSHYCWNHRLGLATLLLDDVA